MFLKAMGRNSCVARFMAAVFKFKINRQAAGYIHGENIISGQHLTNISQNHKSTAIAVLL
jgi:hypothetical protein